jgi:hypothetical protein
VTVLKLGALTFDPTRHDYVRAGEFGQSASDDDVLFGNPRLRVNLPSTEHCREARKEVFGFVYGLEFGDLDWTVNVPGSGAATERLEWRYGARMLDAVATIAASLFIVTISESASSGSLSPRPSIRSRTSCVLLFRAPLGRPVGLDATPGWNVISAYCL